MYKQLRDLDMGDNFKSYILKNLGNLVQGYNNIVDPNMKESFIYELRGTHDKYLNNFHTIQLMQLYNVLDEKSKKIICQNSHLFN